MSSYSIPYATPQQQPRGTARDIFGVVVRTAGLAMTLWGMYCLLFLVNIAVFNAPSGSSRMPMMIMITAFYIGAGIALVKGEWVVRFAYGTHRR